MGDVGLSLRRSDFYAKELDLLISTSYGPGRYDRRYEEEGLDYPLGYVRWTETRNMEAFVQMLAEKKINLKPLITHRFPIERAPSAYALITGRSREPFLGVVIQYAETCDESRTLALVPHVTERASPATDVNVGLLGTGGFATSTLIPAIKASPASTLVAVCAATGAHAQHAAGKFGFQTCTTDEAALIQNPSVNTVVIATRHHLHARQVLAALAAGKHVFCEKPLCLLEKELAAIARTVRAGSSERLRLMVGFNRRFAPMTVRLKSFFTPVSEPLALTYRINAGYLPPDHWVNDREQGGGRILGEVCHFIDLLMFLAASPIVEVEARAVGGSARYSGDNLLATVRFANGSVGTISYLASGDRSFSKERIEVFGGGRAAVLEDFRRLDLAHNGRKETVRSRWRQDKGHRAEWAAFAESVQKAAEPPIPFEGIICSTLATFGLQESLSTEKPVTVAAAQFLDTACAPSSFEIG